MEQVHEPQSRKRTEIHLILVVMKEKGTDLRELGILEKQRDNATLFIVDPHKETDQTD